MKKKSAIVLTGGGTAGHVTPNLAIIPLLKEHGFAIRYIGQKHGMESRLVSQSGISFAGIPAGKLRRYFDWKNLTDIFSILAGLAASILLVAVYRPCCIFSKGGFVACPVVWAGWLLRVPVVIHESDIIPGLANRLSEPFAKKICYAFDESKGHINKKKAIWTGLPIRRELINGSKDEGRRICGFADYCPVLLIMGGSQGALAINSVVVNAIEHIAKDFNVCHVTGRGNETDIAIPGYFQVEYAEDELPHLLALADLIVTRAGATTLFEILALQKPNILIPLPRTASRGDQIVNAQSFKNKGYSEVICQEELTVLTLPEKIQTTYSQREKFIERMKSAGFSDGISTTVEVIEQVCGRCDLRQTASGNSQPESR